MYKELSARITWIPFFSLFMREVRRFIRIIYQSLATPLINTALYLLIFGVSIGREISDIQSHSYLAFLIPGLLMMSTLRNAFDNASGSIIVSKFCGELQDLRVMPLSPFQITWASAFASLLRGMIVGVLTLFIGIVFFWLSEGKMLTIAHPWMLLGFLILGGLAFAHLGLFTAMHAKTFDQVNAISTFILLPLIYLGGVFFSLEHLHPIWQGLSRLNPLFYLINAVRYSMLGVSDVSIGHAVGVSLLAWVAFYLLAVRSLSKGDYHRW